MPASSRSPTPSKRRGSGGGGGEGGEVVVDEKIVAHDRGEGPVDMRKPLIPQIPKLSKAEYDGWVHEAHFYRGEPKYARFFDHDWMEVFSMTYWWVVPIIWIPVSVYLAYPGFATLSLQRATALYALGLLGWSITEYTLHRFLFHLDHRLPDNPTVRMGHYLLHGVHHKIPSDPFRLVFPPVATCIVSVPVYIVLRTLTLPIFNSVEFYTFFGGLYLGYVLYDCLHYAFHHANLDAFPILKQLKSHHMKHHYLQPEEMRAFGITSTVWDHLFGTTLKKE